MGVRGHHVNSRYRLIAVPSSVEPPVGQSALIEFPVRGGKIGEGREWRSNNWQLTTTRLSSTGVIRHNSCGARGTQSNPSLLFLESFVDLILEKMFLVGAVSLVLGVLLWLVQILLVTLLRLVSPERVWTLKIWPALLVSVGIICLTLPAAITRFAPIDLGPLETMVEGERHLTLTGWDQKDYSVLARLPDVAVLQMANDDVTDATLKYVAELKSLRELDVAGSKITDAGLADLAGLTKLEKLTLSRTVITDAGVKPLLDQLPDLKQLDVRETGVTPAVLRPWLKGKEGRRALPRVPVEEAPAETPPSTGP